MLRKKLDALFWRFAEERFEYGGIWPYRTELVFAFDDYIGNLSDDELKKILPGEKPSAVRRMVETGTEKWLTKHAKTMMIL